MELALFIQNLRRAQPVMLGLAHEFYDAQRGVARAGPSTLSFFPHISMGPSDSDKL